MGTKEATRPFHVSLTETEFKQLEYIAGKYGGGINKAVAFRLMLREKINAHTEDWRKQIEAEKYDAECKALLKANKEQA